jgi:FkbM family methyltransferase
VLGSGQFRCWFGTYERRKQALLAELIKPGWVVFDIGAHAGFYSLLAARRVGPDGRVYAFDPLPINVANLMRHIELNHLANIHVFPVAVSDRSGIIEMSPGDDSYSAHVAPGGGITVDAVALDDLSMAGRIGEPNLVKVDAEGAELAVLQGARGLLRRTRPIVLLATHVIAPSGRVIAHSVSAEAEGKSTHSQCIAILRGLGYSITAIDASDVLDAAELVAHPGG